MTRRGSSATGSVRRSSFAEKVCVVTGGCGSLGMAVAHELLADGARVALVDHDQTHIDACLPRFEEYGARARCFKVNVSIEHEVERLATTLRSDWDTVDVLVNNAGGGPIAPSLALRVDSIRDAFDQMPVGTFICSRVFGEQMCRKKSGAIVNISSITTRVTQPEALAYSSAKAAINKITEVLAIEWAQHGVRVNAVAPGPFASLGDDVAGPESWKCRIPLGRFAEPAEVAAVVAFLASERASYITGQCVYVDGGWTAFGWASVDHSATRSAVRSSGPTDEVIRPGEAE